MPTNDPSPATVCTYEPRLLATAKGDLRRQKHTGKQLDGMRRHLESRGDGRSGRGYSGADRPLRG